MWAPNNVTNFSSNNRIANAQQLYKNMFTVFNYVI